MNSGIPYEVLDLIRLWYVTVKNILVECKDVNP